MCYTMNAATLLKTCLTQRHPQGTSPCKGCATVSRPLRRAFLKVHWYLSAICQNPTSTGAAALGVHHTTLARVIRAGTKGDSSYRVRAGLANTVAAVDGFSKSTIHQIVHDFFARNEPPTVENILRKVKEEMRADFPYGRTTLWKILRQLGFKFSKHNGPNLHLLFERADIVQWRARYLRTIHQYRAEERNLVYLDETWFNTNEVPSFLWRDTNVERNPNLSRRAGTT